MMRRPPDKPGSSTVSEGGVESSNATLNTLFGGARQKPWMTGAGASVRPTPRRLSKPSLPTMPDQENASATTVLLSPTPSGGTSPSPYNNDVLHQGSGHLPSPIPTQVCTTSGLRSPTEIPGYVTSLPQFVSGGQSQPSPSQASSNHGSPHLQTENVHAPMTANRQHHEARQPQQDQRAIPQRIQSPIVISESPVQTHAQIPSQRPEQDRRSTLQGIQSPVVISGSPDQIHPQVSSQQSGSAHERLRSTVPPRPERTQSYSTSNYNQTQSFVQASPISPHAVSGNSPFPYRAGPLRSHGERISSLSSGQPWYPGQPDAPPNPHRYPRTQTSQFQQLKSKIALIQSHITASGGTQNLNNSLERPRFQLLTDACDTQDLFYVVLHQIFCTWDYDQSQLLSISGLPTREVLAIAFSILGQLIRSNHGMAINHLRWFTGFPSPLNVLWATSEAYQQIVGDVGVFLNKLALQWTHFSKRCLARQYPPLVDELVNGLGILSHILQGVVFTATRRNLGLSDEPFGPWTEKLFSEDKRGYQEISARYRTQNQPSEEEMRLHNQDLAARYYALASMQPQARMGSEGGGTSLAHSPTDTTNAQLSQLNASQQAVRFLRNIDQVSRNPNPRIPDPRANQHPSPVAAIMADLSTTPPVSMARRPPRTASQQPNAEALSPGFVENLAVLPPVAPTEILTSSVSASPVVPSQGHPALRRPSSIVGSNNTQAQAIPSNSVTSQSRMATADPQFNIIPQYMAEIRRHQQVQNHMLQQQEQPPIPPDQRHMQNAHVRQRRFPSEMQSTAAPRNHPGRMIQDAPPRASFQPQSQLQNGAGSRATGAIVAQPQPQVSSPRHGQLPDHLKIQVFNSIQPPIMRPLLPPLGYTRPNEAPNPSLTALHQAQVHSPVLSPASILDGGHKQPRFYQCMKKFALEPSAIRPTASISKFTFVVNEAALSLKAKDKPGHGPRQVTRGYEQGTLQFRLRCVRAKDNITAYNISEWVLCDTAWPETIFIQVNGDVVEIRRKAHHAKDLPVDITKHILSATAGECSTNHIRVSTPRSSKYNDTRTYFVAVEVVELLDHPHILDMCRQQHIPASKTLNTIKRVLAGPSMDDDDEITMVVSDLSIDLADPFTARIFDIPVRGSSCLHRECFDLETFLDTRKSKFSGQPSLVDVWKCPLCGADARPYALRVDEFFLTVRAKLADVGNLDVKAILVSADGSWKPKFETPLKRKSSNRPDESDDEEEGPSAKQRILDRAAASRAASMEAHQARASANRATEVIVLDDDDD